MPSSVLPLLRRLLPLLVIAALGGCAVASGTPSPSGFVEPDPPLAPSGMPHIRVDSLPGEAIVVLDLIEQGGPYAYDQDGSVFRNREGLLPDRPRGHYREYTVQTPGEDDRGARRIVAGADGERYWTEDHYDSFRWIAE